MIDALRSEWIKLRTTRANVVLGIVAVAMPLVLAGLVAALGDHGESDARDTFFAIVLLPALLGVYVAGCVGVLGIGSEYRHNTIRVTFAANPRRSQVLGAKLMLTAVLGAVYGAVVMTLSFGVGKVILGLRDIETPLSFTDPGVNLSAFVGKIVQCALFTAAGFGLGALIRQPAAAIPVLLLWPLVIESIIGGILSTISDGAARWLPFNEGTWLGLNAERGNDAFARVPGGLYFAAFVAALVALGWWRVERSDA